MRKWHRWIATVAGLFLACVSITGVLLQIDMFVSGVLPPGAEKLAVPGGISAKALNADDMSAIIERSVASARTLKPDLNVSRIEIAIKDGRTLVTLGGDGPDSAKLRLEGATGNQAPPLPARKKNYHYVLQDLHAGYFLGVPGRILSIMLGLSLLVLSITGIKLYLDLLLRRRKAGRTNPFWHG